VYRNSQTGNADNRGLDSDFARETYVPTALDERLIPAVIERRPPAVFLSGNPGDGKTAFLESFRLYLQAHGAELRHSDLGGWEWEYNGHIFRSCYDASEAQGVLSADEQLAQRLVGLEGDSRPAESLTVLVAINDGRLVDFFDRYEGKFGWLARAIGPNTPTSAQWPWLIDLKRRAFVQIEDGESQTSVFQRVLDSFVAKDRWTACNQCRAQFSCPILANVKAVDGQRDQGQARRRLEHLASLVHLRRDYHMTMRDLRSSLAYLLTANLTCEQVHQTYTDRDRSHSSDDGRLSRLVFEPPSASDELLTGISRLDPGRLPHPQLDRVLMRHFEDSVESLGPTIFADWSEFTRQQIAPERYQTAKEWLRDMKRRLYFHGKPSDITGSDWMPGSLLPYRYADRYLEILKGRADERQERIRVLQGIGASDGIQPMSLAESVGIKVHHSDVQQLTVLKEFQLDDFKLEVVQPMKDGFVESIPEVLELTYLPARLKITIGLDLFELLQRFVEGLQPGAPEYEPLLEDLAPFKNALILASAAELVLLEAGRRVHRITQRNGKIVRLAQGEKSAH
jgi:hypothetical protein